MTAFTPIVKSFFDPATGTWSYLVYHEGAPNAVIIDPVLDYDPASGRTSSTNADAIIDAAMERGLNIDFILETHVHADHLTAAPYIRDRLGGRIVIGSHITDVEQIFFPLFNEQRRHLRGGAGFDLLVGDGNILDAGMMPVRVLHTPGHTPACVTYVIGDAVFVGDTLFMPDFGTARCDFPGGDAETLWRSIEKILALPGNTRMFMCHDYCPGGRRPLCETSVAAQKSDNIHIQGQDIKTFAAMRQERDQGLATPALLLPSVQVNMVAGQFPEPDENGISYLRLPLNQIGRSG